MVLIDDQGIDYPVSVDIPNTEDIRGTLPGNSSGVRRALSVSLLHGGVSG
jgi:hypothetical protein